MLGSGGLGRWAAGGAAPAAGPSPMDIVSGAESGRRTYKKNPRHKSYRSKK